MVYSALKKIMSEHRELPVARAPTGYLWDLWPSRSDEYFHNRWLNWVSDWDSLCGSLDDEFRRINKEFEDQFKKTHASQLGEHEEENLPAKVGWKVVENVAHDKRDVQLDLPVKNFKPEELSVKVKDGTVIVQAKHKHEKEGERVYRECMRKFAIPQDVKDEDIHCILHHDGILTIRAPAPQAICEKPKERVLQIEKQLSKDQTPKEN